MLGAVVVSLTAVLGDGHHNTVQSRDGLVTVRHFEGHVREVVVRVGEHSVGETHVGRTHIRSACRSRAAERDAAVDIVERVLAGSRVARHRVRRAVVGRGLGITRNRHRHSNRLDHQLTVYNVEGHRAEVGIRVGEVSSGQVHAVSAGIRADHRGIAAEGEVRHRVQGGSLIAYLNGGHIVTRHGVLGAVVVSLTAVLGDGHRHIDRRDGQLAVRHLEGHTCEVVIIIAELTGHQFHRVFAHVGTTSHVGSIEYHLGRIVQAACA